MKPIHHALVSTKLYGGSPADYVAVHTAFDMSKAALPDMRHRAALHSVDHGAAVMALVFPQSVGLTTLKDICTQHIHDDQGFSVTLDAWLCECSENVADFYRPPSAQNKAFATDPVQACVDTWGGQPEDYDAICGYYALPENFSDHPLAPLVSRNAFGIFFSEMAFGDHIVVTGKSGRSKIVPVRDIGENIALGTFGWIPTLGDVFKTMMKKDWMMGARVARSRARRERAAGRADLFVAE